MKRWSVVLVVLMIAVSVFPAQPFMSTPAQAAGGGEGHFAIGAGSIDHLDPALWYFALTWRLGFALCTPLVTFPDAADEAGKQVVGGLADLPEVSADGKTYTFTLKDGVKFADGKPITGDDVKATFERIFTPDLASPAAGFFTDIVGAEDFAAGKAKDISGITADGNKVTFQLKGPLASFLKRMTMPFTCPIPRGTAATPMENGELLVTGPYKVDSYQPNQKLVLVRNPNYPEDVMGRHPQLDKMTIDIGVDPAQAGLMLRAGQLDLFLENLAAADAAQAVNDATLKDRVFKSARAEVLYLFMNNDVPPFDNVKVRQAVNYAINRNALLRVWGGPSQGAVTDQVLPPTMSGWKDADIYPMSGDPAKAKELLAEAGVTLPIQTKVVTISDQAGYKEVAQAIQAQLKDVGINIEVDAVINSVQYAQISTRAAKVPMGLTMWSQDYPDPDDFIDVLLDGTRMTDTNNQDFAAFNNPEISKEIASLAGVSGAERDARYMALDEKIIRDFAPWAPILNPVRVELIGPRVTNFIVHPVYGPDIAVVGVQ